MANIRKYSDPEKVSSIISNSGCPFQWLIFGVMGI